MGLDPAIISLASVALGGVGVKLVDRWLSGRQQRQKLDSGDATRLRRELFDQVDILRNELAESEEGSDRWRDRYYRLRHSYNNIRSHCKLMQLEVMLTRGELKVDDLHRLRPLTSAGADDTRPPDPLLAAINSVFDDKDLDSIDKEIAQDEQARRDKRARKQAAAKPDLSPAAD